MIYKLPVLGWLLGILSATSMAVPFWLFWTCWGIGTDFFYQLPEAYLHPTFGQCVGVFVVVSCLKTLLPAWPVSFTGKITDERKAAK